MADQYTSRLTPGPGWMFSGHPKSSLFPPFTGAYKGSSATNLGWKIHFDLKSALSLEDSLKEAGMDASRNIIDSSKFKSVAERYLSYSGGNLSEKQVAQGIYDTINFGRRQLPGGVEYEKLFPRITDIFDTADTLRSQGMDFKFGANTYGNWTAYPTSLERRDKLIAVLESSMGSRLEEAKNIESAGSDLLSRFTKGRFTTQYMKQVPEFTKHSWSAVLSDDKFQKLPLLHRREERVFSNAKNFPDALRKFLGSESALEEMMFGPKGYVSPYEDLPSLWKGRGLSFDIPGRTAITPITPHGKAVTSSNIPNTPQLKQSPQPVIPITKHAETVLPVTQQGKPVMNIPGHGQVIDPIEIATRRAKRQADLDEAFNPIQINQRVNAQRKAALPLKKANKAQRRAAKNARALELQKQREEGSKLARAEAERIKAERAAQQVTQPTTVSLSGAAKDRSTLGVTGEVRSKPIYVNPVTGKREGRPQFVGNRKGKLKVGQTREGSIDTRRIAGFEISIDGVPSHSLLHNPTIDAPTYEAYGSISDGSRKKTGMSHGEAVDYISKRVRLDGGTVGNTKSLYGFDQQVKKLIDDGIVSRGDVIDILKGKNQANEFGRILPRSSGAGIVSPPGQLTGMGNILDLSKNAQQLISGLGLEDDMRLSYGEALLQSSRMDQQGGNLSTGKQKQLGGRLNLADKQAMMVDDEKIQTAARLAREEERLAPIRAARVQAVINRGSSELGETIIHPRLAPAAEQAEEVVRKAPISRRTMEKMMSSNMLAAGVAAGGLGLLYASNKMRGEREVGR